MEYTEVLTDKDVEYICKAISGKVLKKQFAAFSKEFSKIKPGFRPYSMSDKEAVDLAIKNFNKRFISGYIDIMLKKWIAEIQVNIEKLEQNNINHEDAVALTLIDSYFVDNVQLYFKLIGEEKESSYLLNVCNKIIGFMQNKINRYDRETKKNNDYDEAIKKNEKLSVKIKNLEKDKSDNDKVIKELIKDKNDVGSQLSEYKNKLEKLEEEYKKNEKELKNLRERANHEIVVDKEKIKSKEYDFISLCEVLAPDYKGIEMIERYADLTESGEFEVFYCDESESRQYANRNKLYLNDGPRDIGTMGIWMWKATQNIKNRDKDFISSKFIKELNPIEILFFHQKDEKGMINILKDGFEKNGLPNLGMYSVYVEKGKYIGFLCNVYDFEKIGNKYKLKSSVITLNKYEFGENDFFKLVNDRSFFYKMELGIPREVISIIDKMELIKNIIIDRNSWSLFKKAGKTKKEEWRFLKNFLQELNTDSICSEIAEKLNCSLTIAEEKLKDFISIANDYINGTTISDNLIKEVILSDEKILLRFKNVIHEEWEAENKIIIQSKQNEIENMDIKLSEAKKELLFIKNDKKKCEKELSEFKDKLELKEQLAEDVENAVTNRIKNAQTKAADFIAEMAFVNAPVKSSYDSDHEETIAKKELIFENNDAIIGMQLKEELNEDWIMTLDSIEYELMEAGVIDRLARPVAAYLYANYLNKSNLLLAGPNAEAIAQAFSCAVVGQPGRKLIYRKSIGNNEYKSQIRKGEIIIIDNPFNSEWINKLPSIMSDTEAFYMGVHPFIEDLQIEPKSYFNYMIPLFTDCIVDKKPRTIFMCSQKTEDFNEFELDYKNNNKNILKEFHLPVLTKLHIQISIANMHIMLEDDNEDFDILFAILPYAYSTMQMPRLFKILKDDDKRKINISKMMMKYITEIYGEFDE